MLNLQIVIVDEDTAYSEKLSNYLMHYENHHFSVKLFSGLKHLSDYPNKNQVDILLTTEKVYLKMKVKYPITILLTDYSVCNEFKHMPCINKYQMGKKIVEKIIFIYTKNCAKEIVGENSQNLLKIIGFYSPEGGSGKTTISIAYAMLLALRGHKTLFFSLEEHASYSNLLTSSKDTSMSDLLYYLKSKPDNLLMKLEGVINCNKETGLMFLPPPLYAQDMVLSETDDWSFFIKYLQSNRLFDKLVIDFTSSSSIKNDTLMKLCNKIILLTDISRIENNKVKAFMDSGNENIKKSIVLISNSVQPSNKGCINEIGNHKISLSIPYISKLNDSEEFIKAVSIESPFKQSMLDLLEVIEND